MHHFGNNIQQPTLKWTFFFNFRRSQAQMSSHDSLMTPIDDSVTNYFGYGSSGSKSSLHINNSDMGYSDMLNVKHSVTQ